MPTLADGTQTFGNPYGAPAPSSGIPLPGNPMANTPAGQGYGAQGAVSGAGRGLATPSPISPVAGAGVPNLNVFGQSPAMGINVGGVMNVQSLAQTQAAQRAAATAAAYAQNNQPVVQQLAAQLRRHWQLARDAKLQIEELMMDAMRSKRGIYSPAKLARIREAGQSEIYMMLFATKARQAKALISDIILGTSDDKPWTIKPTPDPVLPQDVVQVILQATENVVTQAAMGVPMSPQEIRLGLREVKDAATAMVYEEAKIRCERAETKLEDILVEGRFIQNMDSFLDDLMVYKTAFIKGPVILKTGSLQWQPQPDGTSAPVAAWENKPYWQRVDPLMIYPAPWSRTVDDGYLIERHKLSPGALSDMIGTPGYSDDAIRAVLDQYGQGGLQEWLQIDSMRQQVELKTGVIGLTAQEGDLIEALQYWGQVTGKALREWGMGPDEVPDEAKVYDVECWLIKDWVIKAVINADPLGARPYYGASYERIPGAFWGNCLYDVMRDCEDMCNAAARSLANNMAVASGPQVWVNNDRMPVGEDITALYPWKVWQTTSDPMGSTAAPMGFFQPDSNAQPLMAVFDKFSLLADEVTGIPRYMTGLGGGMGEAGRTASGTSMMISNANKTVKNLIAQLDVYITEPVVTSVYQFVMRYNPDKDIKGDLQVIARGALSLVVKDATAQRRNEFLAATANPIDMSIIGISGRTALLREQAKSLDMNVDEVVPSTLQRTMQERIANAQMQMALGPQGSPQRLAAAQQAQAPQPQQGAPDARPPGGPAVPLPSDGPNGGRRLANGAPVTEAFQSK
jgi:hypothetical protein